MNEFQTIESKPVGGRVYLCCECSCWKLVRESSEKGVAAVVAGCGGQMGTPTLTLQHFGKFGTGNWNQTIEEWQSCLMSSHAISCSCVAWIWDACCVKLWLVPSRFSVFINLIFIGFCFNGPCLQAAPAESPAVLGFAMPGNGFAVTFWDHCCRDRAVLLRLSSWLYSWGPCKNPWKVLNFTWSRSTGIDLPDMRERYLSRNVNIGERFAEDPRKTR